MTGPRELRVGLGAAMAGPGGALGAADRLCRACVELLPVDGAAISVTYAGMSQGTFGSSSALSRRLDEFQFTFGEGPCQDASASGLPVLVSDVLGSSSPRWPAFARAVAEAGVRAVYALPVVIAGTRVGALDLFRERPGPLSEDALQGGLWAAELAALPLFTLMTADVDWAAVGESGDAWEQLASLQRVEVHQATGMLSVQLDIDAAEALLRLRAYAFSHGLTASEAALAIVQRRVSLADERSPQGRPGTTGGLHT